MDPTSSVTFGDLLRRYRLAAGLTQEELAEKAQVSPRAISDLERGARSRPYRATVQLLADALQIGAAERAQLEAATRQASPPAPELVGRSTAQGPPPPRHNLPVQLTSFVGREREIAEVRSRLVTTRLLTLTGSGGSGKTRLALRVAADLVDGFRDGAWLVELAPLADPALLLQTVAHALGRRETAGQPILDAVTSYLASKELLLVLDNCEHLVGAAAQLVSAVLRCCPGVRGLATSREPLGLAGEVVWPVPPLPLPAADAATPEAVGAADAARLFVERAQAVQPGFALTGATAHAVAQICRRLDGIPLAIELAAARSAALTPEELLARLGSRLRLLTGGPRDAPARHRTLRQMIAWSYDLLREDERGLFRQIAVFVGGATLEALEEVCVAGDADVVDGMTALVGKNLVRREEPVPGQSRYLMLETIREYGLERLAASPEEEAVRRRHAAYYLGLAEEIERGQATAGAKAALDRLEADDDNLRAALTWYREYDPEVGLRLARGAAVFWNFRRGSVAEALGWLETMLVRAPGATPERVRTLLALGWWAANTRRAAVARRALEECLPILRDSGDRHALGSALVALGLASFTDGRYREARTLLEQGLALTREAGHAEHTSVALTDLAYLAHCERDFARAYRLCTEALAVARQAGDLIREDYALTVEARTLCREGRLAEAQRTYERCLRQARKIGHAGGTVDCLIGLGSVARIQRDLPRARFYLQEGLALVRRVDQAQRVGLASLELGMVAWLAGEPEAALAYAREALQSCRTGPHLLLVQCLGHVGAFAIACGGAARGARLAGAATGLDELFLSALDPDEREAYDAALATSRSALGDDAFAAAWAEGQAMALEQAVALALEEDAS
jgi:predicted ATPase/DNA-binding XRE family transcriptional regulator